MQLTATITGHRVVDATAGAVEPADVYDVQLVDADHVNGAGEPDPATYHREVWVAPDEDPADAVRRLAREVAAQIAAAANEHVGRVIDLG